MASKSNKDLVNIPSLVKGSVQIESPFMNTKDGGGFTAGNGSNNGSDEGIGSQNPQTIAEQIAGSSNPELAFQQYLYQTGLENIFTQYQKNIANLDSARQKDIADAYFIREMSKKYLGEYASNVGIGDVSGNLIDIYSSYAENISGINANYNSLKSNYEAKMLEESQKTAQQLLGTEVSLQLSEYAETMLEAQNTIMNNIQTGDWGDFDNYEDYVNSLDLPDKQKQQLIDWAEQENTIFETTSFTQIKGVGVNQQDLDRFGLTSQPYIDLTYYTNADIMSEYAYSMNGNLYGVATESTEIPTSYLEEISFNYRKDGNGFITYKGSTYVYLDDGTFHKMIAVETEGAKIPTENGEFLSMENYNKKDYMINGTKYKAKDDYNPTNFQKKYPDIYESLGITTSKDAYGRTIWTNSKDANFTGTKIVFYNGRYYSVNYVNKYNVYVSELEKA